MPRDTYLDTGKAILIFLVVLGHLLEKLVGWKSPEIKAILATIYTFHIPAFTFISGMFFKDKDLVKKVIYFFSLLIPFQIIYCLFNWGLKGEIYLEYLISPFWILWYIAAMIAWTVMTPLLKKLKTPVIIAVALSLLIGLSPINNYYFSLGRIFVFFPFFVMGAFYGHQIVNYVKQKKLCLYAAPFIFIGLLVYYFYTDINKYWLYGSFSYSQLGVDAISGMIKRMAFLALSLITVLAFFSSIQLFRGRWLQLGQRTLSVYIFHGFVVLIIVSLFNLKDDVAFTIFLSTITTFLTCLMLKKNIFYNSINYINKKICSNSPFFNGQNQ
ncbi:hypothetical protein ADP71_05030 [Vitreoscilla sp. C1]|uniref:acyltransferase family protein n=1 Tax=Vitreoscilla sp. (strain C1) TaxID=96942 RepID=UPI00148EA42A|nr:acyltransferase family protein [Vitreoscilla sp. C1]AUZ04287.2 hypothetical protein ADP71_05030 [Vitreoscilla sp. C1]